MKNGNPSGVKLSGECRILIIDDEKIICEFLKEALEDRYQVTTCLNGVSACRLMDKNPFDLVIVDLKLPDISGIDVLSHVKSIDKFTEVIIITGFASVDSAAKAINLGASLYLVKPIDLSEFIPQVERGIANRLFHLKSVYLMEHYSKSAPHVKEHIYDMTGLYHFSRKLMLSFEVPEILRIVLEELNEKMKTVASMVSINFMDFCELFAMPCSGKGEEDELRTLLISTWDDATNDMNLERFKKQEIPLTIFNGKSGNKAALSDLKPVAIPMMVMGRIIGILTLFINKSDSLTISQHQFFYVFTSLVSPIIEHGYMDMQARLQAKTDSLTGIANHRMFHETLSREISRSNRSKKEFSLIVLDIDNFKSINDTFGHLMGDAVIKDLTGKILLAIRRGDVLARYGGDEFAITLPDTDMAGAHLLAERICKSINTTPFAVAQKQLPYTISVGVATYHGKEPRDKDRLIADADKALYASKAAGKNRVSII